MTTALKTKPMKAQSVKTKTVTAKMTGPASKTFINVAYKDRDLAKRLGARWDADVRRWYCPAGSTLALIYKWRKAPAVAATGEAPREQANDAVPEQAPMERAVEDHLNRPKPARVAALRRSQPSVNRAQSRALPMPGLFDDLELTRAS